MNINHEALETLAREICDSRNGVGHYDKAGTHKNHWRSLACVELGQTRGLNTLDALMAVFGMKRTWL